MLPKFVAPLYDVMKEKKQLLYTKILEGNRRLDIVALPSEPFIRVTPPEVEQAFYSVIRWYPDFRGDILITPAVWEALYVGTDSESIRAAVLNDATTNIIDDFPELKDDERTVYVCPIVAGSGAGYKHGYVVAWDESDALTVAEYLAEGHAEIYLYLCESNGELLGGVLLGYLSYADVVCDTDTYRRVVAGDVLVIAMEMLLDEEVPESEDPEFPGAEILETFKKLD